VQRRGSVSNGLEGAAKQESQARLDASHKQIAESLDEAKISGRKAPDKETVVERRDVIRREKNK
jgi:hypothetical protein